MRRGYPIILRPPITRLAGPTCGILPHSGMCSAPGCKPLPGFISPAAEDPEEETHSPGAQSTSDDVLASGGGPNAPRARVYTDRAACSHCHYSYPGCHSVPGVRAGAGEGAAGSLPLQPEAD